MKDLSKGKKGQICQLVDPLSQKKQWINLEDIIIYPCGKPIKLGEYLQKIEDLEKKLNDDELKINEIESELIEQKDINTKLTDSIEILLKKYESLNNQVTTLLSMNK